MVSVVLLVLCKEQISGTRMIFVLLAYLSILLFEHKSAIADFLGKISYSLYLTHSLIFQLCYGITRRVIDFSIPHTKEIFVIFMIPLSMLFAYGFYRVVEQPAINWSKKLIKT
jgi:peptidoglycan/LPS O-acetylase OafA/YrhL